MNKYFSPDFHQLASVIHEHDVLEERWSWDDYFSTLALVIARRATCRKRRFGAVIVDKNNRILTTGYNGAPPKMEDSLQAGFCLREGIPSGERYEICRAFHSEQNALFFLDPYRSLGGKIYIAGYDIGKKKLIDSSPCVLCQRAILMSNLETIIALSDTGEKKYIQVSDLRADPKSLYQSGYAESAFIPLELEKKSE